MSIDLNDLRIAKMSELSSLLNENMARGSDSCNSQKQTDFSLDLSGEIIIVERRDLVATLCGNDMLRQPTHQNEQPRRWCH